MGRSDIYTPEQEAFIFEFQALVSRKELTDAFNERFGTNKSVNTIKFWCQRRGLKGMSDGRFKNGHKSWQTGLSGVEYRSHFTDETYSKSVSNIANKRVYKIGDEVLRHGIPHIVISVEPYVPIDKRYMSKRRYVWEQAYGSIPEGHRIINLDGDPMNCELDNLHCLPTKYVPIMNKNHWFTNSREHTLTAIKWCELFYAIRNV